MSPPVTPAPPDSFIRRGRSWVLLPCVAWLISILFLGAGSLFLPIVIFHAPLGIIGCFQEISVQPTNAQQPILVLIHAVFWLLFLGGMALRRLARPAVLWAIWLVLATTLTMSVAGCAVRLGPGLRSSGNWH